MKKIICTLLTGTMLLCCLLAFAACGEVEIPDGYELYENDDIAFAYPEDWSVRDGSIVIIVNSTGAGNNITVAHEAATDTYENMTVSSFNSTLKPVLTASGLSISNAAVEQKTVNGLDVTQISYKASYSGQSMEQTMFALTAGDKTYCITVTEVTQDNELVENVFNTLQAK